MAASDGISWKQVPALAWEDGTPCFTGYGGAGVALTLLFGYEMIDDVQIADCHYYIQLKRRRGKWAAVLDARGTEGEGWFTLRPQVEAMVNALNAALRSGSGYDMAKYFEEWHRLDETLYTVIHD